MPCPAGSYTADRGASACRECPAGSFSGEGASVCAACAEGEVSEAGSAGCSRQGVMVGAAVTLTYRSEEELVALREEMRRAVAAAAGVSAHLVSLDEEL